MNIIDGKNNSGIFITTFNFKNYDKNDSLYKYEIDFSYYYYRKCGRI